MRFSSKGTRSSMTYVPQLGQRWRPKTRRTDLWLGSGPAKDLLLHHYAEQFA
jgi:hypothetical protein